jgi:hypothetical protein
VAERAPSPSTNDRRALKSPQTESFLVWARDVFFTIELVPATLIGLRRRRFLFIRMTDPRRYCQTRLRHDTPREHSPSPLQPSRKFQHKFPERNFDNTVSLTVRLKMAGKDYKLIQFNVLIVPISLHEFHKMSCESSVTCYLFYFGFTNLIKKIYKIIII